MRLASVVRRRGARGSELIRRSNFGLSAPNDAGTLTLPKDSSAAGCVRVLSRRGTLMFSKILRMQFLGPIQLSRLVMYLPQFVRLFYRLWTDERTPLLAKAVPWMGLALMVTPPALELDMIPIVGELDWLVIAYLSLKVFIWLCPPDVVREHVIQIGRGE